MNDFAQRQFNVALNHLKNFLEGLEAQNESRHTRRNRENVIAQRRQQVRHHAPNVRNLDQVAARLSQFEFLLLANDFLRFLFLAQVFLARFLRR